MASSSDDYDYDYDDDYDDDDYDDDTYDDDNDDDDEEDDDDDYVNAWHGFAHGERVWACDVLRVDGRVLAHKHAAGRVLGCGNPDTRLLVEFTGKLVTQGLQRMNVLPSQIAKSFPMPAGLQVGQAVWATQDLVVNGSTLVHRHGAGIVISHPADVTLLEKRVLVNFAGQLVANHEQSMYVLPSQVATGFALPGGFKIGQEVWATHDLVVNGSTLVKKHGVGTVKGNPADLTLLEQRLAVTFTGFLIH